MPKKVGYLYEWMCDRERIREAIRFGAKNKRGRIDVRKVLGDEEGHVELLLGLLESGQYVPQTPRIKRIFDPCGRKWRTVEYVRFFPDGIIQILMVNALREVLMRGMYPWSCASIPGRGGVMAQRYVKRVIRDDAKGTRYVCKMDVRHYYHSVDRKRLIWALARKVKDKRFLKLVWDVLQTCERGLGIGYYLCQWLANYYLERLDWHIKELPGVRHYVRYMDDMVIFGASKKQLHKARKAIAEYMARELGLQMKGNWQVFPLKARALDFVGYRFFRTHTILRRRNLLRIARQCRRMQKRRAAGRRVGAGMAASLLSRAGQLKHCDSQKVREKYIDPVGIKNLKEVVRRESKRRQAAARGVYGGKDAKQAGICHGAAV